MADATSEMLNAIKGLKKDEVLLRIQPDADKSMRGLKTSVGRVASSNNAKIETWTDPAEDFLSVRKTR